VVVVVVVDDGGGEVSGGDVVVVVVDDVLGGDGGVTMVVLDLPGSPLSPFSPGGPGGPEGPGVGAVLTTAGGFVTTVGRSHAAITPIETNAASSSEAFISHSPFLEIVTLLR
jgi:hypothetical protein